MKKYLFFAMLLVFAAACNRDLLSEFDRTDEDNKTITDSVSSYPRILNDDEADPGTRYEIGKKWWNKTSLKYYIDNTSASLTAPQRESIIQEAFQKWAAVSNLTFTQVFSSGSADIKLKWATGSHGDKDPFNPYTPGDTVITLAHTVGIDEIHFNDYFTWIEENDTLSSGYILLHVATHEIGHALGLDHSNVAGAIMYEGYTGQTTLGADDILGIGALYGLKPILGNSAICLSTPAVYTSPYQQGTYTWTTSPGIFMYGSESGNNATFLATSTGALGAGWIALNVNSVEVNRKDVWVGAPAALTGISSENGTYCEVGTYTDWIVYYCYPGSNVHFSAYDNEEGVYGDIINAWNGGDYGGGNYGYGSIYFSEPGNYIVSAYTSNTCGNTSANPVFYSYGNPNPYRFIVYSYSLNFNPKTNEIEIEFDCGQSAKSSSTNNQFTVTILDNNNTARSQNNYSGKNFAVPVSSLSDGTYDVKISDGNITATKPIVIKR